MLLILVSSPLCALSIIASAEDYLLNYTLDELGYDAKTFSGSSTEYTNINFTSPIKYPGSTLYPHLIVMDEGWVRIKVNNATFFQELLGDGEYSGKVKIPTGIIKEGLNTLSVIFSPKFVTTDNPLMKYDDYYAPYEITLLGDSRISLDTSTNYS